MIITQIVNIKLRIVILLRTKEKTQFQQKEKHIFLKVVFQEMIIHVFIHQIHHQ